MATEDAATKESTGVEEFRLSHGGPFFELQKRLGMLREDALLAPRRAVILVAIAWGVPLLLSFAQGQAYGPASSHVYLLDLGVWARFFVAIALFILTEQQVEERLREKLGQFVRAPIIEPTSMAAAAAAVTVALRRRNSAAAEILCVIVGIAASIAWMVHLLGADTSSWAVQISKDGNYPTLAGWFVLVCSGPLFFFLLVRGLWRHLVWGMLLWKLASLELRIVATHPDGNGGLSFLAEYPNAYAIFIFGLSSVVAVALAHNVFEGGISSATFGLLTAVWLAIVLALFAIPLLAFARPLSELKEKTLLLYGAQATRYHRRVERALIGRNVEGDHPSQVDQTHEEPDPSLQFNTARKMSTFVLSRSAVLPLSIAALVPFAVLGVEYLPSKEVLSVLKKLLLL